MNEKEIGLESIDEFIGYMLKSDIFDKKLIC